MSSRPSSPASRTKACLKNLSHADLLTLTTSGCEESKALQKMADKLIGRRSPHAARRAVKGVLLSADLLPLILALLGPCDGVVATVCKIWKTAWKASATGVHRRRLTQVCDDIPEKIGCSWAPCELPNTCEVPHMMMATVARDDTRAPLLVVSCGNNKIAIYDENLKMVSHFNVGCGICEIVATHDHIWAIHELYESNITLYNHDGVICNQTDVFDAKDVYPRICSPVLQKMTASSDFPSLRRLVCVVFDDDESDESDPLPDKISVFDATTLELCLEFGEGVLENPHGMATVGDELFVCDTGVNQNSIFVFDQRGQIKRCINGTWRKPQYICSNQDRLFLVESTDSMTNLHDEPEYACGKRIFVLSLTGEELNVLPVVTPLTLTSQIANARYFYITKPSCFEGKLLVPMRARLIRTWLDNGSRLCKLLTLIGV